MQAAPLNLRAEHHGCSTSTTKQPLPCMCACGIYIYTNEYGYIHVFHMQTNTYISREICIYLCIHIHVNICINTYMCVYIYMYICARICVSTCLPRPRSPARRALLHPPPHAGATGGRAAGGTGPALNGITLGGVGKGAHPLQGFSC